MKMIQQEQQQQRQQQQQPQQQQPFPLTHARIKLPRGLGHCYTARPPPHLKVALLLAPCNINKKKTLLLICFTINIMG